MTDVIQLIDELLEMHRQRTEAYSELVYKHLKLHIAYKRWLMIAHTIRKMNICNYCKLEKPDIELEDLLFPKEKICDDCNTNYVKLYQGISK